MLCVHICNLHLFRMHLYRSNHSAPKQITRFNPLTKKPLPSYVPIAAKPMHQYTQTNVFASVPVAIEKKLEYSSPTTSNVHYYTSPVDATIRNRSYLRNTVRKDSCHSFTFAFTQAVPLCAKNCFGCMTCVKARCTWCKAYLKDKSTRFSCILPGTYIDSEPVDDDRPCSYKVNFLSVPAFSDVYLVIDKRQDVCPDCIKSSIHISEKETEPIAVCYHPETEEVLFRFDCTKIEERFKLGALQFIPATELYSLVDGKYKKLDAEELLKVLESDPDLDLFDDQLVTYGSLDEDPDEDKHTVSQVLDLTPSEIAKLVVENSQ